MLSFTVFDLLAKNLPERAAHTALIDGARSVSYGELYQRAETLSAWLYARGVRAGDRVGIHLQKSIEEVVATFAAARLGAVFVNIYAQFSLAQLRYIADDCGIKLLITDARRAQELAPALPRSIEWVLVDGTAPAHERMVSWLDIPASASVPAPNVIDASLAAILYTSGSTGQPKGVMLSHLNIVLGARSVVRYIKNTAEDRLISVPPFCFDYGLNQLTTMFLVGGTLVLQRVTMPVEVIKTLVEQRITGFAGVPLVWIGLVRTLLEQPARFPALRYLTNTGGSIPLSTLAQMPKFFPGAGIFLMYGLTEAFRSTYLPPELFKSKTGSIGKAIPNVEVYVVNEHGICGPGESGELVHRGSLISMGYWANPAATAEKIKPCPQLRALIGEEKVCYSGDTVRIDEDGYLWFVGRNDSLIKCSSVRLSPTEVEDFMYQSQLIGDAVAFGVADEELGQAVHVAVSARGAEAIDTDGLNLFCRRNMPHYMVPRRVHVWPGVMPRTASGKIDRPTVIESCMQSLGQPANPTPTQRMM
jgi:acyl-CoA ligase (AMP-forming) (exosortase A-associated)